SQESTSERSSGAADAAGCSGGGGAASGALPHAARVATTHASANATLRPIPRRVCGAVLMVASWRRERPGGSGRTGPRPASMLLGRGARPLPARWGTAPPTFGGGDRLPVAPGRPTSLRGGSGGAQDEHELTAARLDLRRDGQVGGEAGQPVDQPGGGRVGVLA